MQLLKAIWLLLALYAHQCALLQDNILPKTLDTTSKDNEQEKENVLDILTVHDPLPDASNIFLNEADSSPLQQSQETAPSSYRNKESEESINSLNSDDNQKGKTRITLEAFGLFSSETEEESVGFDGRGHKNSPEEDVWTDETDRTSQKRKSEHRFFSLMNLIKFLFNPVIDEFHEVEKNPNGSNVRKVSQTSNDSEVAEKDQNKNTTDSAKKTKFHCTGRNVTENTTMVVRVVNSTVLLEVLSFDKNYTESDCVLVMFFAPWCQFCAATAPHYNALGRAFPQLEVLAVDTVHFSNLNARFGTVAVPNIMLFHQSRSAIRFNHTERHFDTLIQFIRNATGLEPNASVVLSDADYEGPLSSVPTEDPDYFLWFAWVFCIICGGHLFIQSQTGQCVIEKVRILWQEHQHIE